MGDYPLHLATGSSSHFFKKRNHITSSLCQRSLRYGCNSYIYSLIVEQWLVEHILSVHTV